MSLPVFTSSRDAAACNRLGYDWPANVQYYQINTSDFTSLLNGLPLTANQARFWVQWASSQWHERTDASFYMIYSGDTTAHGVVCGGALTARTRST